MTQPPSKALVAAYLENFITDHKKVRIQQVLSERTRYITLVLEDIFQPHNISAVIRSCDCFGIQDLHIIEQQHTYRVNPDIVMGASKWISLQRHKNTKSCLNLLRGQGYKIAAMTLNEKAQPLHELSLTQKTALCFGTEQTGLSQLAHDEADCFVYIPMRGFTQSFNISVSAALALQTLVEKMKSTTTRWSLSEDEKLDTKIQWLKKMIPRSGVILKNIEF